MKGFRRSFRVDGRRSENLRSFGTTGVQRSLVSAVDAGNVGHSYGRDPLACQSCPCSCTCFTTISIPGEWEIIGGTPPLTSQTLQRTLLQWSVDVHRRGLLTC